MVLMYSLVLLATAGTAGAYIWKKKPGLLVKTFMRCMLYRSGLRIKQVQVGPYKITYAERGLPGNQPSLLLIHGFSSSKDMWVPVVSKLPRDMHIVVVDLPGHGDSSIPGDTDDITLPCTAHHLRKFTEAVGLTKQPFHIAGCSMGGAVSSLYAAYYPDDVARVTLVCPAMRTPEPSIFREELHEGICRLMPETTQEFQEMVNFCSYKQVQLNNMILEGCLQLRQPKMHFYKRLFDSMIAMDDSEEGRKLEELTNKITAPAQVIWGKQDKVMHISGAYMLRERLPRCERVDLLDDCGHSCSMERPGLVVKLLLAFRNQDNVTEGGPAAQL